MVAKSNEVYKCEEGPLKGEQWITPTLEDMPPVICILYIQTYLNNINLK